MNIVEKLGTDNQLTYPAIDGGENAVSIESIGTDEIPKPATKEINDHVEELRELLGRDVVLLPIPNRQKGPVFKGWQNTTIESMEDPGYLVQLRMGNIGVLLGKSSGGLCAIDIDDDGRLEPFLELNPDLRQTLITKGRRGGQIWVRIAGDYPAFAKLKTGDGVDFGEWRADGNQSVVYGIHPDGMAYQRLSDVPPLVINFEDIDWPDDLVLPWIKDDFSRLMEEHGSPIHVTKNGVLHINEFFFAERYQMENLVIFEPLEDEFYQYNVTKGLWETVSEDSIKWQFGLDLKRAGDETNLDQFVFTRNDSMLSRLVRSLRGRVEKRDAFKKRSPVIHLANGMLDLNDDAQKLMTFHPDYYSRNICPVAFDRDAQCPRFIEELLGSALDEDDISLLQRWAGSILLGNNPAQRLLLLIGTPGGGKSTLIEVIEKIIGEQNVAQIRTKHLHKQFELYKYLGKTLLTGKDVNADFLSEEGAEVIKALVGNDLLDAEKKYGNEQFQLRGNFNVAITCNSKLRVRLEGDTGAWERRLMIINYTKPKPKERITEFADKLIAAEGAGILNWMIEGAVRYLHETQNGGDLILTEAQKERVKDLLAESDSVRQFVQQRVIVNKGCDVSVSEMRDAYNNYCEDMGWRAVSNQLFSGSITDLMLEVHHVAKRNDIKRFDKHARGFSNVIVSGVQ